MIYKIIVKNLIFYRKKVALEIGLLGLLLFVVFGSVVFIARIKKFAEQPLRSMQTEIILENDQASHNPSDIKTQGIIQPFKLRSFSKIPIEQALRGMTEIKEFSTVLILWQFDIKNNKTIAGINIYDPKVGLRKIEDWLVPKGQFFSSNAADEVILERHFATLFGYKLGGGYQINNQSFKIVGFVDFKEESNLVNSQIFMPYETAVKLAMLKTETVNQIYISLKSASSLSKVQNSISSQFSDFSIITKDSLLKNVSVFNRLLYQFGNYFILAISFLIAVLSIFIFKMHGLEFKNQMEILKIIGWPKREVRYWRYMEICFMAGSALVIAIIFLSVFNMTIISRIQAGSLLNQDFKL